METVFDFFINLAIQYQSIKIVGIILMVIGTLYVSLILNQDKLTIEKMNRKINHY